MTPLTPSAEPGPQGQDHDRRMEVLISVVLRTGVITSFALIVLGTAITFVHHPQYVGSAAELQRLTHPGPVSAHPLAEITGGLRDLRGQAIVALGLLVLIATPVLRVAVSVVAFAGQGDRVFTLLTVAVLTILLLSFILGLAG